MLSYKFAFISILALCVNLLLLRGGCIFRFFTLITKKMFLVLQGVPNCTCYLPQDIPCLKREVLPVEISIIDIRLDSNVQCVYLLTVVTYRDIFVEYNCSLIDHVNLCFMQNMYILTIEGTPMPLRIEITRLKTCYLRSPACKLWKVETHQSMLLAWNLLSLLVDLTSYNLQKFATYRQGVYTRILSYTIHEIICMPWTPRFDVFIIFYLNESSKDYVSQLALS